MRQCEWLDTVANVRVHGETHQKPLDLFVQEKSNCSADRLAL